MPSIIHLTLSQHLNEKWSLNLQLEFILSSSRWKMNGGKNPWKALELVKLDIDFYGGVAKNFVVGFLMKFLCLKIKKI